MIARLAAALLAFLLPPAALWLYGRTPFALGVTALWLVSVLVFWFVFAGPGFLLGLLSALAAAGLVLTAPRSRFSRQPVS